MKVKIRTKIKTEFGDFESGILEVTDDQYNSLKNISKEYYNSGFELTTQSGDFMVFSPEVVKKSIFIIERLKQSE
jgi:hypothetical protein